MAPTSLLKYLTASAKASILQRCPGGKGGIFTSKSTTQTDILLFISDQHSYALGGYAKDPLARTPWMDTLAQNGTAMSQAITSCPLCAPARMSMLTGQYASRIGVMDNASTFHSGQATFVHCLNAVGYETVLCGRMHFIGPDQRHGYSRRIAGDRTPLYVNQPGGPDGADGHSQGPFKGFMEEAAIHYMGPGDSPVLAYDRYVIHEALEYLSHDYDHPQFITIGTYAPHFPYTAPKELYDYYYDKVSPDPQLDRGYREHPVFKDKLFDDDPEVIRAARANYYGMVEFCDQNIGKVYTAWEKYLDRNHRKGIFIYVSDHGDQNGRRGYYGKQTFYEDSVHIPMIFCGDGIPAAKTIDTPVSLMDIGPTLCEICGAPMVPEPDGISLWPQIANGQTLDERYVISEDLQVLGIGKYSLGRMVRHRQWKYFQYTGFEGEDYLFNLEDDPKEEHNAALNHPEIVSIMKGFLEACPPAEDYFKHKEWVEKNNRILRKCSFDSEERWRCPEASCQPLKSFVSTRQPERLPKWLEEMISSAQSTL